MKDHHSGHCLSLIWSNHYTGIGCHVRVSCGSRACSCLGDCECLGICVHRGAPSKEDMLGDQLMEEGNLRLCYHLAMKNKVRYSK